MKPVTAETVGAEIKRLEFIGKDYLSIREEFYLNCLHRLMPAMNPEQSTDTHESANGKCAEVGSPQVSS